VFYSIIIVILISFCAFVIMRGMENVILAGENGTFD
jgi:hypothetical protein